MARTPPPHSKLCGNSDLTTCDDCALASYLLQFAPSEREFEKTKYVRRRYALPDPLPRELLESLAADMLERKDVFGPIIYQLCVEENERRKQAGGKGLDVV